MTKERTMTKSIYYRVVGRTVWTKDRECYGTRQDDRRVSTLKAKGRIADVIVSETAPGHCERTAMSITERAAHRQDMEAALRLAGSGSMDSHRRAAKVLREALKNNTPSRNG